MQYLSLVCLMMIGTCFISTGCSRHTDPTLPSTNLDLDVSSSGQRLLSTPSSTIIPEGVSNATFDSKGRYCAVYTNEHMLQIYHYCHPRWKLLMQSQVSLTDSKGGSPHFAFSGSRQRLAIAFKGGNLSMIDFSAAQPHHSKLVELTHPCISIWWGKSDDRLYGILSDGSLVSIDTSIQSHKAFSTSCTSRNASIACYRDDVVAIAARMSDRIEDGDRVSFHSRDRDIPCSLHTATITGLPYGISRLSFDNASKCCYYSTRSNVGYLVRDRGMWSKGRQLIFQTYISSFFISDTACVIGHVDGSIGFLDPIALTYNHRLENISDSSILAIAESDDARFLHVIDSGIDWQERVIGSSFKSLSAKVK